MESVENPPQAPGLHTLPTARPSPPHPQGPSRSFEKKQRNPKKRQRILSQYLQGNIYICFVGKISVKIKALNNECRRSSPARHSRGVILSILIIEHFFSKKIARRSKAQRTALPRAPQGVILSILIIEHFFSKKRGQDLRLSELCPGTAGQSIKNKKGVLPTVGVLYTLTWAADIIPHFRGSVKKPG